MQYSAYGKVFKLLSVFQHFWCYSLMLKSVKIIFPLINLHSLLHNEGKTQNYRIILQMN